MTGPFYEKGDGVEWPSVPLLIRTHVCSLSVSYGGR